MRAVVVERRELAVEMHQRDALVSRRHRGHAPLGKLGLRQHVVPLDRGRSVLAHTSLLAVAVSSSLRVPKKSRAAARWSTAASSSAYVSLAPRKPVACHSSPDMSALHGPT